MRNHRLIAWLLFGCLAALAALAYAPGLHGGFLFDDFANLPALGDTGPVRHWDTFWRYVTSGTADPTGRPLALLSFLLDAHDWPASPYPFKRTNLLLHLANGVLLFGLLGQLGRLTAPAASRIRRDCAAAIAAGLWMIHPLFVSTVLYIVQREAMLPVTFTLLGLLAWLRGRQRIVEGDTWRGLAWLLAGLGGGTALATLSKANGMLLPVFALVLELALLRPGERRHDQHAPPRAYARAMILLAWLPAAAIAGYLLLAGWKGLTVGISDARPWTLGQRLLTEPRVLLTYLRMLWLPTPFTAGLFNDQVQASASLWHPWTTLPAIVAVLGLVACAWRHRERAPALAAAVLFFFVGQSIESSTIALELFFEHRNYLPALLMFWPLALWLCDIPIFAGRPVPHGKRHGGMRSGPAAGPLGRHGAKPTLALICLAGLLAMTWARAGLWGNTRDQALLWGRLNPASPRAQAFAAYAEVAAGFPERAIRRLQPALQRSPGELQLALNLVAARCAAGRLDPPTVAAAEHALATARDSGSLLTSWFGRAIGQAARGDGCPGLDLAEIDRLLLAAKNNPKLIRNHGRQQDIDYLRGRIAIRQGDPDRALALFNEGLREQPRASLALSQAAELGAAGFPAQGLKHLELFDALPPPPPPHGWDMRRLHAYVLEKQRYWPRELARLRATLRQDLLDSQATSG